MLDLTIRELHQLLAYTQGKSHPHVSKDLRILFNYADELESSFGYNAALADLQDKSTVLRNELVDYIQSTITTLNSFAVRYMDLNAESSNFSYWDQERHNV